MNKKAQKIIVFAVFTLVLLLVIRKTDFQIIGGDLQDILVSTANDKSFSPQDFLSRTANLRVNGDEITSLNEDPMLHLDVNGLPWYKYVKLDVTILNRKTTDAQIFYSINGSGLSEANSILFTLKNGINYVRIFKDPSFDLLRFDPAREADVSLRVNSITLTNHFFPRVSDAAKIILPFIILELLCILCFTAKGVALFKRIGDWFMSTEDE
jgi:hypothetical protein